MEISLRVPRVQSRCREDTRHVITPIFAVRARKVPQVCLQKNTLRRILFHRDAQWSTGTKRLRHPVLCLLLARGREYPKIFGASTAHGGKFSMYSFKRNAPRGRADIWLVIKRADNSLQFESYVDSISDFLARRMYMPRLSIDYGCRGTAAVACCAPKCAAIQGNLNITEQRPASWSGDRRTGDLKNTVLSYRL